MGDIAIRVENLSKRYRMSPPQAGGKAGRENIYLNGAMGDFGLGISDCGFVERQNKIRNPRF